MNKRERISNLINGKPVDRTPVGFWLHFPPEARNGDAAIQAHIDFMNATDTDIMKVMNENVLHDEGVYIKKLSDIHYFRTFSRKDQIFKDQSLIIRRIAERIKGDTPILATIHGLLVSAFHQTGYNGLYSQLGYGLTLFCRERPQEMKDVFKRVAESLIDLVDCSLESGADGIFYAALGGERHFFTDDEFEEFIAPYEKEVYDYIKSRTPFNILHICKSNINLNRYTALDPKIVNWAVYEDGVSLTQGHALFPNSIILGGFDDRAGVLVDGTQEEICNHTKAVLDEMRGIPFIVGSDCTLPTEISYQRIHEVVKNVIEIENMK